MRLGRLVRGALVVAALVFALALLRAWSGRPREDSRSRPPETVEGPARITDGDTLHVDGRTIRLRGVDAPERAQSCTGPDGAAYACGERARGALGALVEGRTVACRIRGRDRYRRWLGRCRAGDEDVGERLVRDGLAVAYRDPAYAEAEAEARRARRGLWAGTFEEPEQWRRERRARASR